MSSRKLNIEIERTFKRVAEGIAAFEGILEKLNCTTNSTQKDKHEADLKKEIKKLQRHRDQIKTWASGSEIKDKKPLLDQRRLIETQMEKFKAIEKEMKTKAFSKEGLLAASKLDPKEREKLDFNQFLSSMVDELERQIEVLETEIETLQATMKKGKKETAKTERLSEIEHHIERHRWHQGRLELILRLIENGNLQVEEVTNLKEDIKYYVESNQDVDFAEDINMYDDLNLADEEALFNQAMDNETHETSANDDNGKDEQATKAAKTDVTVSKRTSSMSSTTKPTPAPAIVYTPPTVPIRPSEPLKYASAAAAAVTSGGLPSHAVIGIAPFGPQSKGQIPLSTTHVDSSSSSNIQGSASITPVQKNPQPLPESKQDDPKAGHILDAKRFDEPASSNVESIDGRKNSNDLYLHTSIQELRAHIPTSLADLIESFDLVKNRLENKTWDQEYAAMMLERSIPSIPTPLDADAPHQYFPLESVAVPAYYPQYPLIALETPEVISKMDLDTLFFLFYYQRGTYSQYLAARELKEKSWRFHKRYVTWFQRHDEPKHITDDYEMGCYKYFDFEGSLRTILGRL